MENQKFMEEGIDGKRILLLLGRKIWVPIVAAFVGALLGGGVYLLVHLLFASQREYESVSKIYLNFDCSPQDFNELTYNGYTWNDLMATDPILDYTMENLPPEVERETVIQATKAEILSDIRLLTITITTDDPELTGKIMEATQASLIHLGETDELFESIEVYSTSQPQQIVWDNRTVRAAVSGMVVALAAAVIIMAFYYVMDDSVYTAKDVEKRYGIPAIGILPEGKDGFAEGLYKEFLVNYRYLSRGMKATALISPDSRESAEKAGDSVRKWLERDEGDGKKTGDNGRPEALGNPLVYGMPEEDTEIYQKLRKTDGAIIAVRFGAGNGKRMERLLGNLKKQDCSILGAVIVEPDENFLKMYYMGKGYGARKPAFQYGEGKKDKQ